MALPSAREYAIWPKDRTVTVSDGTPLAYTVVGDGPKTPILFVNGWSCSDADRVAALMPVAGTFENPVKTFADLPSLDRIYPLADVLLGLFPFAFLKPFNKGIANPETGLKMVKLIRVAGPKVTAERLAPHLRQLVELDFSVLFKMMGEQRKHVTADFLPTITAPTLVLAGRHDLFTPPSVQQKMADLIPHSEIVWFDEGGHMLPIEEPEGIVAALRDFMDRRVDVAKPASAGEPA